MALLLLTTGERRGSGDVGTTCFFQSESRGWQQETAQSTMRTARVFGVSQELQTNSRLQEENQEAKARESRAERHGNWTAPGLTRVKIVRKKFQSEKEKNV
jgi:hypothetical protein